MRLRVWQQHDDNMMTYRYREVGGFSASNNNMHFISCQSAGQLTHVSEQPRENRAWHLGFKVSSLCSI